VLPVVEAAVVERVEHQLALDADEVEGPGAVLGDERSGGREVLAQHDLDGLVARYSSGACLAASQSGEGLVEVLQPPCSSGSPVWRSSLP
jgi:hypothetical protein